MARSRRALANPIAPLTHLVPNATGCIGPPGNWNLVPSGEQVRAPELDPDPAVEPPALPLATAEALGAAAEAAAGEAAAGEAAAGEAAAGEAAAGEAAAGEAAPDAAGTPDGVGASEPKMV